MPKVGKQKQDNAGTQPSEADLVYNQGLYSGLAAPGGAKPGFLSKLDLSVYAPLLAAVWVFCYAALGMGILPPAHGPLRGLALVISILALLGAFTLFRSRPGLGARPANRTAAMALAMMIPDFWIWTFNRPFAGLPAHVFLLIDIAGFAALLFCVYMFVYQRLHVEIVVRALSLKAFFDFAAYVLAGGFGIEVLSRMGIAHPLHSDALFSLALLELWILLVYIVKYRNKINVLN